MVWGGISLDGRPDVIGRGALTAVRYRDEVLQPIVRPFAGAGPDFILMQDNAHSQSRHRVPGSGRNRCHGLASSVTGLESNNTSVRHIPTTNLRPKTTNKP